MIVAMSVLSALCVVSLVGTWWALVSIGRTQDDVDRLIDDLTGDGGGHLIGRTAKSSGGTNRASDCS